MRQEVILSLMLVAVVGFGFAASRDHGKVTVEAIGQKEPLLSEVIEQERLACDPNMPRGVIEGRIEHETGGKWDERAFNPEKQSKGYQRSKTEQERSRWGSRGLMQVVAAWHYRGNNPDDLFNPFLNIRVGVRSKLCPCWKQTGTVKGTFTCYNGKGAKAKSDAAKALVSYQRWKKRI